MEVVIGFFFVLYVCLCPVVETLSSVSQKRERAAEEWPSSLSASSSPEGAQTQTQEYEYVYVDENGDYYKYNEGDEEVG